MESQLVPTPTDVVEALLFASDTPLEAERISEVLDLGDAGEARRLIDNPITLEDLADEFGISRERVRQIEVRAFEKVQKAVRHRVAAMERPEALAAH